MEASIITALKAIRTDVNSGVISTSGELAGRLQQALTLQDGDVSLPRYASGEPPIAAKFNYLSDKLAKALHDREYVFDILLAASVYDFDTAAQMLDDLENKALALADSLKTLYLFSKPSKGNVHTVGTDFTAGFGVWDDVSGTISRNTKCGATLPIEYASASVITPKCSGSGIAGRYYLYNDSESESFPTGSSNSTPDSIVDSSSSTSFEWERFRISPETKLTTGGYGFGFSNTDKKWADTTFDNVELELEFAYSAAIMTNYILISPAANAKTFTIESIALYLDGEQVREILEQPVIVSPELFMHTEDGYTNEGSFIFPHTRCNNIKIKFNSSDPEECLIKHYWKKDANGVRIASESPSTGYPEIYVENPMDDEDRGVEVLSAERFFIALQDIVIEEIAFGSKGFAKTKEVRFHKPIDRIAINVVGDVPDETVLYFMVSVDNGQHWYELNPVGSTTKSQVLAINDMTPQQYQDSSTNYITVDTEPYSLIAKMYLERPQYLSQDFKYATPTVKFTEIKVTLK